MNSSLKQVPEFFSENFDPKSLKLEIDSPGAEEKKELLLNELLTQFIISHLSDFPEHTSDCFINQLLDFFDAQTVLLRLLERLNLVFVPQTQLSVNYQLLYNLMPIVERSEIISTVKKYAFYCAVRDYLLYHIDSMGQAIVTPGLAEFLDNLIEQAKNAHKSILN